MDTSHLSTYQLMGIGQTFRLFLLLVIMNNVVINIHVNILFLSMDSLAHSPPLCLTCEELPNCFTKWLDQFAFPPTGSEGSNFPLPFPTLMICLFDDNQPSVCEMVSYCGLICICRTANDAEHLFMGLLPICISSLGKCLFRSFRHF